MGSILLRDMDIDLTLKNYRCFPDSSPARIYLRKGFTAFIGANNSGKSSLLRFFYEFRRFFELLSHPSGNLASALHGDPDDLGLQFVSDPTEIFCNRNNRDMELRFDLRLGPGETPQRPAPAPVQFVVTIPRNTGARANNQWLASFGSPGAAEGIARGGLNWVKTTLQGAGGPIAELSHVFEMFATLAKTFYIGPFRNILEVDASDNYFDISVGKQFIAAWRETKTGRNRRLREAVPRLERDIAGLLGFDKLSIDPSSDGKTLHLTINENSYTLSEVGSGITHLILVLANVVTREPSYVLIDEPELNLHPSLQLDFLTTLGTYASHGVLFSTHSIGLARAAAERVYSFRVVSEGESQVTELEATPRLSEFLGELSFSGYQELGFDKVLLVEGKTDIKTIQQFLRLYKKEHKIVLVPLGGGTLISDDSELELREILRISSNISVLIDSERKAPDAPLESSRQAFVDTCKRVGLDCHVLERRAIENYFTDRAIRETKTAKYSALGHYDVLEDASPNWGKAENWRIARAMTLEELETTDLGEFLTSL